MFKDLISKGGRKERMEEGKKKLPSKYGSGILRKYAMQEALKKAKNK